MDFWPHHYPEIEANTDAIYLSQNLGMRKPEPEIFQHVLEKERFTADQALFFDDVIENIEAARAAGIKAVWVEDSQTVPKYFS